MAKKNEQTGKKAGTAATKTLKDKDASKDAKTVAGSALTQRTDSKKKKNNRLSQLHIRDFRFIYLFNQKNWHRRYFKSHYFSTI